MASTSLTSISRCILNSKLCLPLMGPPVQVATGYFEAYDSQRMEPRAQNQRTQGILPMQLSTQATPDCTNAQRLSFVHGRNGCYALMSNETTDGVEVVIREPVTFDGKQVFIQ